MKIRFPNLCILLVVLTCILIDLDLKNWREPERVVEHDVHFYYSYLPSFFIYDDIKLEKSTYQYTATEFFFWPFKIENGNNLIKMTCGLAILYAPFFGMGHLTAQWFDYPLTGFSEPYKLFLLLSSIFYLIIGLIYTDKLLRHFKFPDIVTGLTILILGLGTNLLCYASQSAPMSHVYSFALFAMFLYHSIHFLRSGSWYDTLITGITLGLITLIRPTNGIIVLVPLLYSRNLFGSPLIPVIPIKNIVVVLFCVFLVWIPQLIYWKYITGDFYYYSYNSERFYFSNPQILKGLFSFQKGWLIYTPVMIFALAGVFLMKDELKKLRPGLLVFLILNVYIIFSWWCWWYGGSYGQRPMIESYALLSIPLAAFIHNILSKKLVVKIMFTICIIFMTWLNIFQTYQYEYRALHWDGMSATLYVKQFGSLEKISDYEPLLESPDPVKALKGEN